MSLQFGYTDSMYDFDLLCDPNYLRHAKTRMEKLLKDGDDILAKIDQCNGVATRRDSQSSKRRRILCRSIDEQWEGG